MQFESLKIFCDVVRWSSFSRGATENGVCQSTASQAVHQLELRLGVKLIDRSKRPLVPTPQGKLYYDVCKDLVSRYLEVENRVKSLDNQEKVVGTVRVSSIYSVGLHHLPRYVQQFGNGFPDANVAVEYLNPTGVIERVREGVVDLGLISYPRKWSDLVVTPWREEEMVLAVHPAHRFAGCKSVPVAQLGGETFVGFDAGLPIRRGIDRFLRRQGVHVRVSSEFDNIENIKKAVELPAGIAIIPEPTFTREVQAGTLLAIRIDGKEAGDRLTRPLAIIRRRSEPLSLAASRFLELLTGEEAASAARTNGHVHAKS